MSLDTMRAHSRTPPTALMRNAAMNENAIEKLVVVTRQTALEELTERFNTREQARFYIEHIDRKSVV